MKRDDLSFMKIVGTGNDFLFIDARASLPTPFSGLARSELALRMCDRHFGAGADGLVFVEERGSRIAWDFYNSDGSVAEMCGNASRCMGRWASLVMGAKSLEFETTAGLVRVEDRGATITSHLNYLRVSFQTLPFVVDGQKREATLVNTGVPHAVVEIGDVDDVDPHSHEVQALRFHEMTGAKGANVTFLQIVAPQRFRTVTFERGVEGLTLSCGTGVLAAAAVGLRRLGGTEATVQAPGGELKASFQAGWQGGTLEGPAQFLYEGRLPADFVKGI